MSTANNGRPPPYPQGKLSPVSNAGKSTPHSHAWFLLRAVTKLCTAWKVCKQEADRRFKVLVEQSIESNPGLHRLQQLTATPSKGSGLVRTQRRGQRHITTRHTIQQICTQQLQHNLRGRIPVYFDVPIYIYLVNVLIPSSLSIILMILIEPIQKPSGDGESDFHSSGTKPNTTGSSRAVSKSEEEPGAALRCRAVHVFGRFSVLATKRLTNICTFCGLSRQTGRAVEAFLWRFSQPVPEIGLDMPRYASLVVQADLPVRASYSPKRYCTCVWALII